MRPSLTWKDRLRELVSVVSLPLAGLAVDVLCIRHGRWDLRLTGCTLLMVVVLLPPALWLAVDLLVGKGTRPGWKRSLGFCCTLILLPILASILWYFAPWAQIPAVFMTAPLSALFPFSKGLALVLLAAIVFVTRRLWLNGPGGLVQRLLAATAVTLVWMIGFASLQNLNPELEGMGFMPYVILWEGNAVPRPLWTAFLEVQPGETAAEVQSRLGEPMLTSETQDWIEREYYHPVFQGSWHLVVRFGKQRQQVQDKHLHYESMD